MRAILYYNENKVDQNEARLILASGFAGDAEMLDRQQKLNRFSHLLRLKPNVKTNAVHITLNFHSQEKLGDEKLQSIGMEYMDRIGFGEQPFLIYRHLDAAHGNKGEETRHANNLIAAVQAVGIQQIVHTSVARAGDHESFVDWDKGAWEPLYWEEKAAAIDAVKAAGFAYWTIIKPPFIMVNLLPPMDDIMFPTISSGKIATPIAPETKIDWVSPNDIGRFAAEAFAQPEKFNKKEFAIVGDTLTMEEVADVLSTVTGKPYEAISQTEEEAFASGLFKYGIDSYLWQNAEGYKIDPHEAAEFGIQPESLKSFLEKNKSILKEKYSALK